jgi:hypothetical protein
MPLRGLIVIPTCVSANHLRIRVPFSHRVHDRIYQHSTTLKTKFKLRKSQHATGFLTQVIVGRDGDGPAFYAIMSFPEASAAEAAASVIQRRPYKGAHSLSARFVTLRSAVKAQVQPLCSLVAPNIVLCSAVICLRPLIYDNLPPFWTLLRLRQGLLGLAYLVCGLDFSRTNRRIAVPETPQVWIF